MIAQLPMLYEILELERRSNSRLEDVDEIPGIERLWNARGYYLSQRYDRWFRRVYLSQILNDEYDRNFLDVNKMSEKAVIEGNLIKKWTDVLDGPGLTEEQLKNRKFTQIIL